MRRKKSDRINPTIQIQSICICGQNATKVGYAQERKSGKDRTHRRIQLESNWVSIAILLNPYQNPFGFHLKHSWNPIGF